MKTLMIFRTYVALTVVLLATFIFFGCSKEDNLDRPIIQTPGESISTNKLSPDEIQGLKFIAEQEKMVSTVYSAIASTLKMDELAKMANVRKRHMSLISVRLDKYDLENPLKELSNGEFKNPLLQKEYNEIMVSLPATKSDAVELVKTLENSLLTNLQFYVTGVHNVVLLHMYQQIIDETQQS